MPAATRHPPSLWAATAAPAPPCRPLAEDLQAEVAIVSGGFTGLSTALHLAEAGREVVLLETEAIGWGASGRNGGQVNPGARVDRAGLVHRFGEAAGEDSAPCSTTRRISSSRSSSACRSPANRSDRVASSWPIASAPRGSCGRRRGAAELRN